MTSHAAPSVSVVVAARDAEGTLASCLDSVLAGEYPAGRLEVIVVDNGSRDRTRSVLDRYRGRVRALREELRGSAAARNAGIEAARGEVIAFTDADCVADPAWLARLVPPLSDPGVAVACGEVLALDPGSPAERFGEVIHDARKAIEVYRPPYAVTANWASPRSMLLDLGGFDESFTRCQDVDLSYRAVAAGYRLVHARGAIVRHRNERSIRGLGRQGYRHGRHGRRVERKHRPLLDGYGYGRLRPPRMRVIGTHLRDAIRGPDRRAALYEATFMLGKRAGMAAGSLLESGPLRGARPKPADREDSESEGSHRDRDRDHDGREAAEQLRR